MTTTTITFHASQTKHECQSQLALFPTLVEAKVSKMSAAQLYEDLAKKYIKHSGNLNILHYAGNFDLAPSDPAAFADLASWVPD